MSIAILPGITAQTVTTSRLTTRVLLAGPPDFPLSVAGKMLRRVIRDDIPGE